MDKQSLRESWVQRIEAYRKSGLSAKAWCEKNRFYTECGGVYENTIC